MSDAAPFDVPADWYRGFFEGDWLDEIAVHTEGSELSFDSWRLILLARKI